MTTVPRNEVQNLAANSPSLDEFAALVFSAVSKFDASERMPVAGVVFSEVNGTSSFRATAHKIDLIVRYEQEIRMVNGSRTLRGGFKARLDEPLKADRIVINAFWFDNFGTTDSPSDVIHNFYKQSDRADTIRADLAYWLADGVQQHIQVAATEQ